MKKSKTVKKQRFTSAFHGKEQYEKVAKTIRELGVREGRVSSNYFTKKEVALAFTRMFSKDNAGFIAHRFVDACEGDN